MNILMMTNTYKPYVGGVERSVSTFTEELRRLGHHVVVVAPEPDEENAVEEENDVIRIPAIPNFNESNLPLLLPIPGILQSHLETFQPDLVHSHFPFLIGSTAVRVSAKYEIPLVFTYHTMYEKYIHYASLKSDKARHFVIELTRGYANLCDLVIAPSRSIESLLKERQITTPIEVVPTGVDVNRFAEGNGAGFRKRFGLAEDVFVVGHTGRLAPEKNLDFLARAAADFLRQTQNTRFLILGDGSERKKMEDLFRREHLLPRVIFAGKQKGQDLVDGYHAMDVFAFSSLTETQGLVVLESMAAGLPVVALNGPGVQDVLRHGENGFLIEPGEPAEFTAALKTVLRQDPAERRQFCTKARQTAQAFSVAACTQKLLAAYEKQIKPDSPQKGSKENHWQKLMNRMKAEWELFRNLALAAGHTLVLDKNHTKKK